MSDRVNPSRTCPMVVHYLLRDRMECMEPRPRRSPGDQVSLYRAYPMSAQHPPRDPVYLHPSTLAGSDTAKSSDRTKITKNYMERLTVSQLGPAIVTSVDRHPQDPERTGLDRCKSCHVRSSFECPDGTLNLTDYRTDQPDEMEMDVPRALGDEYQQKRRKFFQGAERRRW